jgi:hypothetical protein
MCVQKAVAYSIHLWREINLLRTMLTKVIELLKLLFPFGTLLELVAAAALVARAKTCIFPPVRLAGRVTLARTSPPGIATSARNNPTTVVSFPLAVFW